MSKNKNITYFIGGIFGALVGLLTVFLLEKSDQLEDQDVLKISPERASKVGLGIISFLWGLVGKGQKSGQGKGRRLGK